MILTWSKELPSKPGWYWTRGMENITQVVHRTIGGEFSLAGSAKVRYQGYFDGGGREWAGPIPEPTNLTAMECGMIMKQADEKFLAARHARIRDLAERMMVVCVTKGIIGSPTHAQVAEECYNSASAVVSECERRERANSEAMPPDHEATALLREWLDCPVDTKAQSQAHVRTRDFLKRKESP